MRFFNLYQYLAPLLLFPVSYYLWLRQYQANQAMVWLLLTPPILFAYIIPGLGTNWLKLWTFNTRLRLGQFRPHHGFVFGTATSLFALLTLGPMPPSFDLLEFVRAGFILGSVLAFWNWIYDILAIRAGFIIAFNRPYAAGRGAEAIATDYAPVLFGTFGCCYGVTIRLMQYYLLDLGMWDIVWWLVIGGNLFILITPVIGYMLSAYLKYGDHGLKAFT